MHTYDSEIDVTSCAIDQSSQIDTTAQVFSNLTIDAIANDSVALDGRSPDYELGWMLSAVLKYGVMLASGVVFVGGMLYLAHHGTEPVNYHIFQGEPAEFCSPWGVIQSVLDGRRRGIVQFGLLLLIATPMMRVVFSLGYFIYKRDRIYTVITLLVISGLFYSFLGAYH